MSLVEGQRGESNGGRADKREMGHREVGHFDREQHPFEALGAVKLHVLHGWPRWWAWTFASLVAEIAIGFGGSSPASPLRPASGRPGRLPGTGGPPPIG